MVVGFQKLIGDFELGFSIIFVSILPLAFFGYHCI